MKAYVGWSFFLGAALSLPFLVLPYTLPRGFSLRHLARTTITAVALFGISCVAWLLETFYNPHYSAPATGLILLLILFSIRQLRLSGKRGLFLARATTLICVLSFAVRILAAPLHIPLSEFYEFSWYQKNVPGFGRADIQRQLEQLPGKQLVIVHYAADHNPFAEWVYNKADIKGSKIIWARETDPAQDKALLDYYNDRHVWNLNADENVPTLIEYSGLNVAPASGKDRMQAGAQP
jgi:hypothetical protein